MVLLMSVEPGFGGQRFIPSLYRRARTLRDMLAAVDHADCLVEADGGITLDNIREVCESGVNVVVSGTGIFDTPDPIETMREMRNVVG